jgi:beta-xylosidase
MRRYIWTKEAMALAFLLLFSFMVILHTTLIAHAWQSDNGNGTFTNPPLYADYPDPDIIRVGEYFYMVSTTFADSPGITVLRSQDMVNWEIIAHAASILDMNSDYNMLNGATAYRKGMWASSIRYHNGTFYIVVNPWGASGARVYYATDPAGPWNYYQLNRGAHDPGFFIDDNGTGYIFYGSGWLSVLTLNSTYSAVVSNTNNVVNGGGEGSHVIKRGSYYYLFNANPGTWPFQLRCSRATSIFGSWETGHICLLGTTGGHQGAIVDIDDSDNWFGFVHQDSGSIGRMTRIGPVFWESNWPVFGTTTSRDVMASTYTKPIQGKPLMQPPTTDHFCSSTLGLQWQWNHNPDNSKWSLTERPGYLRLKATQATGFWTARNTLTQKGQGPWSRGQVKFDLRNLQPGDICGFGTLGKYSAHIAVNCDTDETFLSMKVLEDTSGGIVTDTRVAYAPMDSNTIMLRMDLNFQTNKGLLSYSFDGVTWTSLGGEFPLAFDWATGTFQGEKFAIFCYNPSPTGGYVDVDSFIFTDSAVTPLYGDMNGDNTVNMNDLSEFVGCWLLDDCGLDLNGDCVINLYEFAGFANNWLDTI